MTTITHPVLKGHSVGVARRRLTFLGVSTPAMWTLAAVVVVLNMIGLIMVMSASSVHSVRVDNTPWSLFTDQVIWTAVGLVALVAAMMVSVDFWRRIRWVLLGISLAGLVAVLVPGVGVEVNGATRWVALGGFQFQPSEAAKFALLIFVADLLARREHRVHDWRWALGPTLAYVVLVGGLIMLQPNLGTTMIIVATTMAVLWAAGVPGRSMALTGVGFALAGAVFMVIERFRTRRFLMFLDPRKDPTGDGLQNIQSFIAIANGVSAGVAALIVCLQPVLTATIVGRALGIPAELWEKDDEALCLEYLEANRERLGEEALRSVLAGHPTKLAPRTRRGRARAAGWRRSPSAGRR